MFLFILLTLSLYPHFFPTVQCPVSSWPGCWWLHWFNQRSIFRTLPPAATALAAPPAGGGLQAVQLSTCQCFICIHGRACVYTVVNHCFCVKCIFKYPIYRLCILLDNNSSCSICLNLLLHIPCLGFKPNLLFKDDNPPLKICHNLLLTISLEQWETDNLLPICCIYSIFSVHSSGDTSCQGVGGS